MSKFKERAKELGYEISHSHLLELCAIARGFRDYNTYKGVLKKDELYIGKDTKGKDFLLNTESSKTLWIQSNNEKQKEEILNNIMRSLKGDFNIFQLSRFGSYSHKKGSELKSSEERESFIREIYKERIIEKKSGDMITLVIPDLRLYLIEIKYHMNIDRQNTIAYMLDEIIRYAQYINVMIIVGTNRATSDDCPSRLKMFIKYHLMTTMRSFGDYVAMGFDQEDIEDIRRKKSKQYKDFFENKALLLVDKDSLSKKLVYQS